MFFDEGSIDIDSIVRDRLIDSEIHIFFDFTEVLGINDVEEFFEIQYYKSFIFKGKNIDFFFGKSHFHLLFHSIYQEHFDSFHDSSSMDENLSLLTYRILSWEETLLEANSQKDS